MRPSRRRTLGRGLGQVGLQQGQHQHQGCRRHDRGDPRSGHARLSGSAWRWRCRTGSRAQQHEQQQEQQGQAVTQQRLVAAEDDDRQDRDRQQVEMGGAAQRPSAGPGRARSRARRAAVPATGSARHDAAALPHQASAMEASRHRKASLQTISQSPRQAKNRAQPSDAAG